MRALSVALAALLAAAPARAVEVLTGTLQKAAASGAVVVGYRTASIPFSYLEEGRADHPVGYAIDLCQEIVDDIGKAIGREDLALRYAPVTSENRIPALVDGTIDLECGSTTANAERRRSVAFSPVTFVSATKLLVPRGSTIASYRDLGGKRVVVTAGTTNEGAVRALLARLKLEAQILTGRDHAESFAMVRDGRADAFALDDVLLYGLIARAGEAGQGFTVLPDKLSFEPYGIMFRKDDPALAAVVAGTFARLAESRELRWMYEKWFLKRLPGGARLNVPMSDELRTSFQVLGLDE
ncbi:amino acid ABC transporter substrate-binding protein [Methylobacterium sp. JK268]